MLVIGLISGTSVDGVDAALVEISGSTVDLKVQLLAGETFPYTQTVQEKILAVCRGAALSIAELAELDDAIAEQFAQAAQGIQQGHPPAQLIGSHGQTVFHRPAISRSQSVANSELSKEDNRNRKQQDSFVPNFYQPMGYSLQLGRGALIANLTDITTISNFRAEDIAAYGQGAPMVSKIDACLLGDPQQSCCVQNLGGIGNVTYLPAQQENWETGVLGWDTGPANSLLDLAVQHLTQGAKGYDENGSWAATGQPHQALVQQWLQQEFFRQRPPKSTGRELFGWEYLHQCLQDCEASHVTNAADILATLTELTAGSIVYSYETFLPQLPDRVLLCGGGSKNGYLKQRLQALLSPIRIETTNEVGLSADFKEAIAFAVLAYWRMHNIPGNLPAVTGANQAVLLGEVHHGY